MALPATIDPAAPAGTDPAAQGDDQIRALKQALIDILGLPSSPSQVTVALMTVTTGGIKGWEVLSTFSPASNTDSFGARIAPTINKAGSGTHALFSALRLDPPTIGAAGSTLTEASTLYIGNAPSVGTNLYAFHIAAGNARIDGILLINTGVTTSATPGDIVIPNNKRLRAVNAAGTDTIPLLGVDANNNVVLNLGVLTFGTYTAIESSGGVSMR